MKPTINLTKTRCHCQVFETIGPEDCDRDILRVAACAHCYTELLMLKNQLVVENQELLARIKELEAR